MHPPPAIALLAEDGGEPFLVERTARALRAVGWAGVDPDRVFSAANPGALGAALRMSPGPALVLRAGVWPAQRWDGPPLWPAAADDRLIALGAVRSGPDAAAWRAALGRGGGEFSAGVGGGGKWFRKWRRTAPLPAPVCVWLGAGAARAAGQLLERDCPTWESAVSRLVFQHGFRAVRWLDLDVRQDPGLRVLQVVTTLQRGGAERVTLDLAAGLNQQGVACAVAVLAPPGRNAYPAPPACFDLSETPNTPAARAAAIVRAAVRWGADVIHGHLLKGAEARALKALGLPLTMTVHNTRPGWPVGLADLGPGDADLLLGCADAVSRELPPAVPSRTLFNGIDADALAPARTWAEDANSLRRAWRFTRSDFILLALANPRPQKRLERLPAILAATQARLAAPGGKRRARLVVAGSGSQHGAVGVASANALVAEIDRLGVAADVRRVGDVENVRALLAAADVLVSPSAHEGLSLAWLEALAAGRPVVTADVGGAAEVAGRVAAPGAFQTLPADAPPERWAELLADLAIKPPATAPGAMIRLPDTFRHEAMARRARSLYGRVVVPAARRRRRPSPEGVWLLTNNLSCGGAQSSARRLLVALAARGVRVRATVAQETGPTRGRLALAAAGIPVHAAPPPHLDDPGRTLAAILRPLDADPPAAVLFWNLLPGLRVGLADAVLDTPVFDVSPGEMSFDSLEDFFARPRPDLPYRTPRDYGARLAGAVVKYHGEAQRAEALLGCRAHVIPNGVASPPEDAVRPADHPGGGSPLRIGVAARLSPDKRLGDLLAAVRLAHHELRRLPARYQLLIAGDSEPGNERCARELRRLARGLPVRWLGRVEDMDGFLRGLDIFAMISRPAGCPNASLEAMAAGLPVVATDWGGAGEQVVDGETGRLTPDGDAPAFAAALVELARDPALRARFGRAGRERVREQFSVEAMANAYANLCRLRSPMAP